MLNEQFKRGGKREHHLEYYLFGLALSDYREPILRRMIVILQGLTGQG